MPLGILKESAYESRTLPFLPGATLVLYTDGLIETPKPPRNVLDTECLKELLNKTEQSKNAYQVRQSIVSHVFAEPAIKADDDVTLLVAKHRRP